LDFKTKSIFGSQAQIAFYSDDQCSGSKQKFYLVPEGECGANIFGNSGSSNYFCVAGLTRPLPIPTDNV
jgi:hypothetical protein